MKKIKRGTPEKLVCDFCGAEKKEITFMIGACSKPGADWCMIYGTGKMACPACYVKATAEAESKGREFMERQAAPAPKAKPEAAAALSRALVAADMSLSQAPAAPVEPAACQECSRKRGQRGPCSDYGGFGCGLYFEQHPETHFKPEPTAPAKIIEAEAETVPQPVTKAEADASQGLDAEGLNKPAAPAQESHQTRGPRMSSKICCICGATTKGAQHWNRDTGYGVCPVCVAGLLCKGTSAEEIKDLYGVEGVNYPSLAEADAALARPAPAAEEIAPGSFDSEEARAALLPILDRVIRSVYLPDYRAKVTNAEALGVLTSKFFKWDGAEILAAAFSGLEDANNHQEAAIIERMQKGEDLGRIITNLEDQNKAKARIIAAQSELIEKMAKELSAMHSEYCKDCPGGCPTLELIEKAKNAGEVKEPTPSVIQAGNILAALIWQRDYCDKQAAAGTEDAALWRQAAGRARLAIERIDK